LDNILLRLYVRWQLQLAWGDILAFQHFSLSIQSTKSTSPTEIQVLKRLVNVAIKPTHWHEQVKRSPEQKSQFRIVTEWIIITATLGPSAYF